MVELKERNLGNRLGFDRVTMTEVRFPQARRKDKDRRSHPDQDYSLNGGIERRSDWGRRALEEGQCGPFIFFRPSHVFP